jgi:diguanylate cyclase (GGDEF)-like protein
VPEIVVAQIWLALEARRAGDADGSSQLAVALVDLDDFRGFNDARGHVAGNALLVDLAKLVRDTTGSSDLAARIGGDEFLLAWPGDTAADAVRKVDDLRSLFEDQTGLTLSGGVADLATVDPDLLLRAADEALYAAKKAGRDCVRVYRP